MTEGSWDEVAELFADLLELPEEERAAALADRTPGRPTLRAAVQDLLTAHDNVDSAFLAGLDEATTRKLIEEAAEPVAMAGAYRLVREIGRGGMGTVHLGERADGQFEKAVAVKMLKRGMDSEAILKRFLRERQILASFRHAHIAALIDGGIAVDGRPYIVMEYVDGLPITDYCDARRMSIDDRLALFNQVCEAVAYAHRNLVVHRDLKPSNILVTDDGEPKLLDFGIAKVLAGGEAEDPLTTDVGARLMTPEYAAPEQLAGLAVTTATDVFGLGAVLFELLSGTRPFSPTSDQSPSVRASTTRESVELVSRFKYLGEKEAASIAAARGTDVSRLTRGLLGDLDTIVAKALRPEPDHRYASSDDLRKDIERHQAHLPIDARPATLGYRVQRFVQRHRAGVGAGLVVGALAIAFAGTATLQGLRIRAQAADLEVERDRAQVEAATASEVADFLVGVFQVADPMAAPSGDSITARALLDRGADRIQAELATEPELRGRLLDIIVSAYQNLGLFDQAEPLAMASVEARREAFGAEDARVGESLKSLGQIRSLAEDFPGAEEALREALVLQQPLGDGDPALLSTKAALSRTLFMTGGHQEGTTLASAVAERLRTPSVGEAMPREVLWEIVPVLGYTSDFEGASQAYGRLAELESERGGPYALPAAEALYRQAGAEASLGNIDRADSLFNRALAIRLEVSPDDVATGTMLRAYGQFASTQRDFVAADSLTKQALDIFKAQLSPDHIWIGDAAIGIALTALENGDFQVAADYYQSAAEVLVANGSREASVLLPLALWRGGEALWRLGKTTEAEAKLVEALSIFEASYSDDYLLTANVRRDLGTFLARQGRGAEALPVLEAALRVLAARWGPEDFRSDGVRVEIARALDHVGRSAEALEMVREVLPRLQEGRGPDHPYTTEAVQLLARLEGGEAPPPSPLRERIPLRNQNVDHPRERRPAAILCSSHLQTAERNP